MKINIPEESKFKPITVEINSRKELRELKDIVEAYPPRGHIEMPDHIHYTLKRLLRELV